MAKLRPKVELAPLRHIGCRLWDSIGLKALVGDADKGTIDEDCIDEYDTYLIGVAGMLINGRSIDECTNYLSDIETNRMGLGQADIPQTHRNAKNTALAIKDYIDGLTPPQKREKP